MCRLLSSVLVNRDRHSFQHSPRHLRDFIEIGASPLAVGVELPKKAAKVLHFIQKKMLLREFRFHGASATMIFVMAQLQLQTSSFRNYMAHGGAVRARHVN